MKCEMKLKPRARGGLSCAIAGAAGRRLEREPYYVIVAGLVACSSSLFEFPQLTAGSTKPQTGEPYIRIPYIKYRVWYQ